VDVRIGVIHTMKEIELELPGNTDRDALKAQIDEVLADDDRTLWIADKSGREIAIPSARVAYVELGRSETDRKIGFSA